jgi:hypothetical protein
MRWEVASPRTRPFAASEAATPTPRPVQLAPESDDAETLDLLRLLPLSPISDV